MDEELFQSAKRLKLRDAFRKAAAPGISAAPHNKNALRINKIEQTRENLVQHLERNKGVWYGQETAKLFHEHRGKLKPTLTPKWIVDTQTSPGALARQALNNVNLRCEQRLKRFEEIALRAHQRMNQSNSIKLDQQPRNRME